LANDLVNCPGVAIVIGAPGITLDLNGHKVDGNGVADVEGIRDDGYDGVTIEDGSITDFVEGVAVLRARGIQLRGLSTRNNRHTGIFVDTVRDTTITDNGSADQCAGVIVTRSSGVVVGGNIVNGGVCAGIPVFESDHVRIVANGVSRMQGPGIALFRGSHDDIITRNTTSAGDDAGVVIADDGYRNLVDGNTIVGNGGDGIVLDIGTNRNVVTNNSISRNVFGGIVVVGSDDNQIAQNLIVGNGDLVDGEGGIRVFAAPDDPTLTSDRNTVSANVLRANAPNGILIEAGQVKTLAEGNTADSNAHDGIEVDSPATTLAKNTANRNGNLGIEAVQGVTDGGANTATGNGNPLQCTNVVCS
jgi:parallel beta-helix repeat protein